MQNINFLIAFGAGVASFFAPCVVPLLPAYIGYVTGISLEEVQKGEVCLARRVLLSSLLYAVGFTLVFTALGAAASTFGAFFRINNLMVQRVGGLIILLLGLDFAGFLNIKFLKRGRSFKLPDWASRLGAFRSFLVGVIFALAWSPCVGAVLGAILALAAVSQTVVRGSFMLFFYSLGITVPFILIGLTMTRSNRLVKIMSAYAGKLSKFAGIMLAILGLLLLTNLYSNLYSGILNIAIGLGYTIR